VSILLIVVFLQPFVARQLSAVLVNTEYMLFIQLQVACSPNFTFVFYILLCYTLTLYATIKSAYYLTSYRS
jgi:hypothetical protein